MVVSSSPPRHLAVLGSPSPCHQEMGEHGEVGEQEALRLTENLVRMAIYSISYVRGLFPDRYFCDKSVPVLEMMIKALMPMNCQSRSLVSWMEEGVHAALQKKYLKTLLFSIWNEKEGIMIEEFSFSFSYPDRNNESVEIKLACKGRNDSSIGFNSNAADTTEKMRTTACKMIRKLVSHMNTIDHIPEEPTVLLKLQYRDDIIPEDYEPPCLKYCADRGALNILDTNHLMGELNNRNLVLAMKVKSVLYTCDDNNVTRDSDKMTLGYGTDEVDYFTDFEGKLDREARYKAQEFDNMEPGGYANILMAESFIHSETMKRKPIDAITEGAIDEHEDMQHGDLFCVSARKVDFFLDSGAERHICRERFCLHNFKKLREEDHMELTGADQEKFMARHKGDIMYHNIKLHDVLFAPQIGFNVVSVGELDKQGLMTCIGGGKFSIYNVRGSKLTGADQEKFMARHKGDIMYHNIKLHDVLFAPQIGFNVVSVGELDKQGLMTCIGGGKFSIYNVRGSKLVAEGYLNRENNDYIFSTLNWRLPKKDGKQRTLLKGGNHDDAPKDKEEWLIDSLCARHMVPKLSTLSNVSSESFSFRTATGEIMAKRKGQVTAGNIMLSDVMHCPELGTNLMSVAQLDKLNYSFTFYEGKCQIQCRDTLEDVGYGYLDYEKNRYLLTEFTGRTNLDPTDDGKKSKLDPTDNRKKSKKRRI